MAMLHKIRFLENERVDKPDHDQIQEFVADDFKAYNRHFFTSEEKRIIKGFAASVTSGLNISVAVDGSALFNTEDTDGNEFYLGESGHAALTATLTNGATNYIHLQISSGNTGTSATRVFWDPSLNSGDGGEFLQSIDTEEYLDVQLYITTTGFSTDADKIPLATMVASGGAVISTIDNRNLFFRLGKGHTLNQTYDFTLSSPTEPATSSFTGGDKDIESLKDWMDFVMTTIKQMKGTTYWFEEPPSNLAATTIAMTGGGTFAWDSGSGQLTWSAAITFLIPNTAYTNQISSGSLTMSDNQVAYVDIDRTSNATLTPTVVNSSAFTYDKDRLIIARRISSVAYVGLD